MPEPCAVFPEKQVDINMAASWNRTGTYFRLMLIALIDDIAILAVVLLVLWAFHVKFSLPVILVISLLFGARVYMTYHAVHHSIHKKKSVGLEAMIGLECEVIEPLTPEGVVRVCGEYWNARSDGGDIAAGEEVEVVAVSRLNLEVRCKGQ